MYFIRTIRILLYNWHLKRWCAIMSKVVGEPITVEMVKNKLLQPKGDIVI